MFDPVIYSEHDSVRASMWMVCAGTAPGLWCTIADLPVDVI